MADPEGIELTELRQEAAQKRRRFSASTTFASFRYRNFTILWMGQITNAGALWLEIVARPLLVLAITGSAAQLGLVMGVRTAAALLFGLLAGVVADNFKRRTVLLAAQGATFITSLIFALLIVFTDIQLWMVYFFTLFRGITMAFDQPARRAMIPSIVPKSLVTNAMALSTGSIQIMRIAGAAAAGLLVGFGGFEAAFLAIAGAYLLSVLFNSLLRVPDHTRRGYEGVRRMGGDMMDGLRYAWGNANIRGVLVIAMGYFIFGLTFLIVFAPLFGTQVLGIGEEGFGLMISMTGVGGIVGAVVLASASPSTHRGLILLITMAAYGVLMVIFSGATYLDSRAIVLPLVFFLAMLVGFGQSIIFPLVNASLVDSAKEEMRGRVLGLLSMDRAMSAFGGAIAGFMAAALGVQMAMIVFGVGCFFTAVGMFLFYPALRRID